MAAVLLLLLESNPESCHEHLLPVLRDYARPKQDGLSSIMLVCAIASSSLPDDEEAVLKAGMHEPGTSCGGPRTAFVNDLVRLNPRGYATCSSSCGAMHTACTSAASSRHRCAVMRPTLSRATVQVAAVLPHVSTHHHQTRCFAHLILHGLLCKYPHLTATVPGSLGVGAAALRALKAFTEANPHAQRLLEACPVTFDVRARDLCHPRMVLRGAALLIGTADPEPVECAAVPMLDRVASFLEQERSKLREQAAAPGADAQPRAAAADAEVAAQTYQRKIEPWEHLSAASMCDEDRLVHVLGYGLDALLPEDPRGLHASGGPAGWADDGVAGAGRCGIMPVLQAMRPHA